jgi:hypothetical protein
MMKSTLLIVRTVDMGHGLNQVDGEDLAAWHFGKARRPPSAP